MAFRMQASVPDLVDTSSEPEHIHELYGEDSRKPGTFAANCLLARRLAERNVRFIQLYHRGWDHHAGLTKKLPVLARDTDQPAAGLIKDLKQRGMLDDTLVIWGGEFGRTPYAQGAPKPDSYGRDHHGRVFSLWMAGGGVKRGIRAWQLGRLRLQRGRRRRPHTRSAGDHPLPAWDRSPEADYHFQGRQFRLTDVEGRVVKEIVA